MTNANVLPALAMVTARSRLPSLSKSPRHGRLKSSVAISQQDHDSAVGSVRCHRQVGDAVTAETADRDRRWGASSSFKSSVAVRDQYTDCTPASRDNIEPAIIRQVNETCGVDVNQRFYWCNIAITMQLP